MRYPEGLLCGNYLIFFGGGRSMSGKLRSRCPELRAHRKKWAMPASTPGDPLDFKGLTGYINDTIQPRGSVRATAV